MASDILVFAAGFAVGAIVGWAGFIFYLRRRTRKQLAQMEDQMGDMFDLPDEAEQE